MVGIQALGTYLFLAFEAEQNVVLAMLRALMLRVEVRSHHVGILLAISIEFLQLLRPRIDLTSQVFGLGHITELAAVDDVLGYAEVNLVEFEHLTGTFAHHALSEYLLFLIA